MLSILFSLVSSQNTDIRPGFGVAIDSANSFCLMMPAEFGARIADYDSTGVSQCWNNPAGALGTSALPAGFVTSAHFVETQYYKQVTGTYNSASYGLDPTDTGTQWDNSLASQGGVVPWSGCAGTPQYLEFLGNGIYCLRCCKYAFSTYCNPSNDTQGCHTGIPGNMGSGFDNVRTNTVPTSLPVLNYNGCSTTTDTCANSGFVCCNSIGDANAGLLEKGTCQPPSNCKNQLPPQAVVRLVESSATVSVSIAPITVSGTSSKSATTTKSGSASSTGTGGAAAGSSNSGIGKDWFEVMAMVLGFAAL